MRDALKRFAILRNPGPLAPARSIGHNPAMRARAAAKAPPRHRDVGLGHRLRHLALLLLLAATPSLPGLFASPTASAQETSSPDEIIVKFKARTDAATKDRKFKDHGAVRVRSIDKLDVEVLKVPKDEKRGILEKLRRDADVEYAEPDFLAQGAAVPNDEYYHLQYGLSKVQAPQAFDVTRRSSDVLIGIVDSGVDTLQPDLQGKVVNKVAFTGEGVLDDNQRHGTHVAGVAAARTGNVTGVGGMGYNSRILSAKVLDSTNHGSYSWISSGIIWATDHGARVINLSLGGTAYSQTLEDAVNYALARNVVVVAAAGNLGNTTPLYPAYFDRVIAVAATDQNDNKTSFSSYGTWVDVAAPGIDILSTCRDGWYCYGHGTSMAAPLVSGLAALLVAQNPTWTHAQVKDRIESSADAIAGTGTFWTAGRINAFRAVAPGATPSPTTELSPTASPTATPSQTAEPTPTASPTAEPSLSPSPPATPTSTTSPTAEPSATPSPTATPTQTTQPSPTSSPTTASSPTPSPTATRTPTPVASRTPTASATPSPTLIPSPSPTALPAAVAVLEAESFSSPQGSVRIVPDAAASNSEGLLMSSSSTASKSFGLNTRATKLSVRARGDQCSGAPRMTVRVDGKQVLSATVSSTTWKDYSATINVSSGARNIQITYSNDFRILGRCDRNLSLDKATLSP